MKVTAQRSGRRRLTPLLSAVLLAAPLAAVVTTVPTRTIPRSALAAAATLRLEKVWQYTTPYGRPIAGSSPMLATLGSTKVVVVGDRSGHLYGLRLADGGRYFIASTGGAAIDSTASVLGAGSAARLFVGVGNSANAHSGFYWALDSSGRTVWTVAPRALPRGTLRIGVQSSMTIATLARPNTLVSGTMGQLAYAMYSTNGGVQPGFPWFEADSNFATPAVMDPLHVGRDMVVLGGDSSAGIAYGYQYRNGGHIRVLRFSGNRGTANMQGGLYCQYNTNQVVQASPAVGPFLRGGGLGIVAGTGAYFPGASDTNKLIAVTPSCHLQWKADLHGLTNSSPALANVMGNGALQVVQGTRMSPTSGRVYALSGASGGQYWVRALAGGVYGGIVTADLTGLGYQDVIVPTTGGTYVLDGKTGVPARIQLVDPYNRALGVPLAGLDIGSGFQNSALVTADPGGAIGITIAGYDWHNRGIVIHYRVVGSNGSRVSVRGAWPMFHHDARLSGNASHATP